MTKRLSAEKRRESIIDVAKRLFAQEGFHGVTIDEIVNAVGVSPSILYRVSGNYTSGIYTHLLSTREP
ncbi:MAG: helix-turn-helix transcriptional regulator [Gammaproteobacteria bacterium]|nr:helix-turn-helix transcriptional regulator [Gammaproteobacteria bacterium]